MITPDEYTVAREQLVVKANELIQRDRFSLSVQQQKIILFLISKIKPDDTKFNLYEFDIVEFCNVCGIDARSGKHYQSLKEAIKDIADKSIYLKLPDRQRETLVRWIEKPYFNEKSGIVQIKIDEDMRPYLLQLKENFTKYELVYTLCFRSQYSLRLYELLKMRHYKELETYEFSVAVEELRNRLLITDPQKTDKRRGKNPQDAPKYPLYADFKARALLPAVKEINECSDIEVNILSEEKRGRAVNSIKFSVRSKTPQEIAAVRLKIDSQLGSNQLDMWRMLAAGDEPAPEGK